MLLLLALVSLAFAGTSKFTGVVSLTANVTGPMEYDYTYRHTGSGQVNIASIVVGSYFFSFSAAAKAVIIDQKVDASGNRDVCYGLGGIVLAMCPSAWFGYWDSAWTFTGSLVTDPATAIYQGDYKRSSGLIGVVYPQLREIDGTTGLVVRTVTLEAHSNAVLSPGMVYYLGSNGKSDYLTYTQVYGQVYSTATVHENWMLNFTYLSSAVLGKTDYADAIVSPKMFETIIAIKDYPYADLKNHLELDVTAITGKATVAVSGNAIVHYNGTVRVYLNTAKTAIVNDKTVDVVVSKWVDVDVSKVTSSITADFKAKFDKDLSVKTATVAFPAGATEITYDPAMGQGIDPTHLSPAGVSFPALFVLLAALLLLFF
jgi:hypothetical protein